MLFSGKITLPPRPATRPRFTCRGRFAVAYTDRKYREWLDAAEEELRTLLTDLPKGWDTSAPVRLTINFNVLKPKTSKLIYPKPDLDNYEKAFMDAVTQAEGFWDDDCQVVQLNSAKNFVLNEDQVGIDFTFYTEEA